MYVYFLHSFDLFWICCYVYKYVCKVTHRYLPPAFCRGTPGGSPSAVGSLLISSWVSSYIDKNIYAKGTRYIYVSRILTWEAHVRLFSHSGSLLHVHVHICMQRDLYIPSPAFCRGQVCFFILGLLFMCTNICKETPIHISLTYSAVGSPCASFFSFWVSCYMCIHVCKETPPYIYTSDAYPPYIYL